MTKYSDSNRRYIPPPDTPIIAAAEQYDDFKRNKERYCKWCNHLLHKIRDFSGQNENLYCNNCSASFEDTETNNLRSKSKLTVPNRIEEPAASIIPEPTLKRRQNEIKGGLKALSEKGLKITNYKEGKG